MSINGNNIGSDFNAEESAMSQLVQGPQNINNLASEPDEKIGDAIGRTFGTTVISA